MVMIFRLFIWINNSIIILLSILNCDFILIGDRLVIVNVFEVINRVFKKDIGFLLVKGKYNKSVFMIVVEKNSIK